MRERLPPSLTHSFFPPPLLLIFFLFFLSTGLKRCLIGSVGFLPISLHCSSSFVPLPPSTDRHIACLIDSLHCRFAETLRFAAEHRRTESWCGGAAPRPVTDGPDVVSQVQCSYTTLVLQVELMPNSICKKIRLRITFFFVCLFHCCCFTQGKKARLLPVAGCHCWRCCCCSLRAPFRRGRRLRSVTVICGCCFS